MPLKAPFETSFGVSQHRRIILVEVVAEGVSGWGEVTAGETPGYNSETTDTAWHVISDFVAPSLIGKSVASASECPALLAAVRGRDGEERRGRCVLGCGGDFVPANCDLYRTTAATLPMRSSMGLISGLTWTVSRSIECVRSES